MFQSFLPCEIVQDTAGKEVSWLELLETSVGWDGTDTGMHPSVLYQQLWYFQFQVLKLLGEAWRRRLIFTVATSSTTGEQDTVVWNEIHHKTEAVSNNMGHGYPDPNYLDNVLTELAAQGVQDEEENELQPEEGVRPQVSWC